VCSSCEHIDSESCSSLEYETPAERRRMMSDLEALVEEPGLCCASSRESLFDDVLKDGAGLCSNGNWCLPRSKQDFFACLRTKWLQRFASWGIPDRCAAKAQVQSGDGLFSPMELDTLRRDLSTFLWALGIHSCSGVVEHQPFHLDLMAGVLEVLDDPDAGLPHILKEGVPTGVLEDIPISGSPFFVSWGCVLLLLRSLLLLLLLLLTDSQACKGIFPRSHGEQNCSEDWSEDVRLAGGNWASAGAHGDLLQDLVNEELEAGFLEQWHGSLEDAELRWPGHVAVMKLAVVVAEGRSPRLIADASAPGINARSRIPERIMLPTIQEVKRALALHYELFPNEPLAAAVIDVKSAHKRIKIKEADGGLGFVEVGSKLFRYRVCSFGAKFSAYWWARTAAALTRILHSFVYFRHYAFIYVDDLVLIGPRDRIYEAVALALAILCVLGTPISWAKLKIGSVVPYLGFLIDVKQARIGIDTGKVEKVQCFLDGVERKGRLSASVLQKGIGLLIWASWIVPSLRPWMAPFYQDLNKPGAKFLLVSRDALDSILDGLDGKCKAKSDGAGLSCGWELKSVGKQPVHSLSEARQRCHSSRLPEEVWLRFSAWRGGRVRVSPLTSKAAALWRSAMANHKGLMDCAILREAGGAGAADAWASSSVAAGLGGWFIPEGETSIENVHWFCIEVRVCDFPEWFRLSRNMQEDIAFYELLAQVILALMRFQHGGPKFSKLLFRHVCDNSPSVGAIRKNLTTKAPSCFALQMLAFFAAKFECEVSVSHIEGKRNVLADRISRFREYPGTLEALPASLEMHVDITELIEQVWR
jgi:hypothetical protein